MSENRYEVSSLIGKGRTGGVYVANDNKLERKVALRRFFDEGSRIDFTKCKDDFLDVARSLINLQHANIARVLDTGEDEDGVYIISELLEGKSLYEEAEKSAMEVHEVVELARQMLDALSVIHDQGLYHEALTPRSILMTPQARGGYRYMILDTGLTKLAPLIEGENVRLEMMADHAILAPELFDGSESNAQADLYMLGQIMYFCLAGGHPYEGLSAEGAKEKHLQGLPPIKEFNKDVPQELQEWLSVLTDINPAGRPDSAVEALQKLPQIKHKPVIPAPAPMTESEVVSGNPIKPSPVPISAESISKATAPVPITAPSGVQSITAPIPIYSPGASRATKSIDVSKQSASPKVAKETMRVNLKAPSLGQETMRVTLKASDVSKDTMRVALKAPGVGQETMRLTLKASDLSKETMRVKLKAPGAGQETMRVSLKASDLENVNETVVAQPQLATAEPNSIAKNQASPFGATPEPILPERKPSQGLFICIGILTVIVVLLAFLISSQSKIQVPDEEASEYTASSSNEIESESSDLDKDTEE